MNSDAELTYQTPTLSDRIRWKFEEIGYRVVNGWRAFCERLKWIGYREGNIESHARHELTIAGWFSDDGLYGSAMGHAVMRMLREFAAEGHSGMSASVAVGLFQKLAKFEPLVPLTGGGEEWNEVGNGVWQNRRCSHVLKTTEDGAYDIHGRVFREPSGACYTNRDSRVPVTFPYSPKTEYVDVPDPEGASVKGKDQ